MSHLPPAIVDLLQRHLATGAAPVDPLGHLATYHPDAVLPIGADLVRRDDVEDDTYAARWNALLAGATPADTGPAFSPGEVLAWQADETGGRLAIRIDDGRGGSWPTAWLFEGDEPLIRAVCHLDGPLPTRTQLLTEAHVGLLGWGPFLDAGIRPLSPLGILWHDRAGDSTMAVSSLPESRFTCQNRGECCQVSRWLVPVSANVDVALDGIPWEELTDTPPRVAESRQVGLHMMPDGHGACQARSDGGCSVHRALGRQPIPICQLYPIQATLTPDGYAVAASFTCRTVAENIGTPLGEQAADIRSRLRPWHHDLHRVTDPVRFWPEGPTMPWATYRAVEAWLLDVLADRRRGDLAERVLIASSGMAALFAVTEATGRCPDDPLTVLQNGSETPKRGPALLADALMGTICGDQVWGPVEVRPFGGWLRSHWSLSRMATLEGQRDDELATRYVRTVLFRKPRLGTSGLAFTWGLVAWMACLWDRQSVYQSRHDQVPADRPLQVNTAKRLDQLLLHTSLVSRMEQDADVRARLSHPNTWLAFAAASG